MVQGYSALKLLPSCTAVPFCLDSHSLENLALIVNTAVGQPIHTREEKNKVCMCNISPHPYFHFWAQKKFIDADMLSADQSVLYVQMKLYVCLLTNFGGIFFQIHNKNQN